MLVRHRAALDRLTGSSAGCLYVLGDQGELALCLHGQGVSIKLVPLPLIRLTGHGDHVIERLFAVGVRSFQVTTQRVDTRAQRDEKSGCPDSFARVAPFELAPFNL